MINFSLNTCWRLIPTFEPYSMNKWQLLLPLIFFFSYFKSPDIRQDDASGPL